MTINRLISIAPMMAYTDRHYRMLMRIITQHTLLYTEMVTTGAVLNGDRRYLLEYSAAEHPLALQLGGSDPQALAQCARIAEDLGYAEVNLNVGCPSDRVQSGQFGACLMKQPQLVGDCVAAMRQAVRIPVTVKNRLGVDDCDSYDYFKQFTQTVAAAGCQTFIVHARKAWLSGLSPHENRTVPPLRYEWVYQLKQELPQLEIIINGGIRTIAEVQKHLSHVDGVMIGREAYSNPYLFAAIDAVLFAAKTPWLTQTEIVHLYLPYMSTQLAQGVPLRRLACHLLALFQGCAGARQWRRYISENSADNGRGIDVIRSALQKVVEI